MNGAAMSLRLCVLRLAVLVGACGLAGAWARADELLWRLGIQDDSSAEFAGHVKLERDTLAVPSDWRALAKGLRASVNPVVQLDFNLPAVPENGVVLSFKLLQAPKSGAQMAVFANGAMAGLIQMWGTAETTSPYPWRKTYRLYIPREMLQTGGNVLRLETARPMWSDASVDDKIWWEWDYLKLESLSDPAREPVHGTLTYLGTTLKHSSSGFDINDETVRMAGMVLPWMGIAYSGNTIRADFWYDVQRMQPRRLEYLKRLCDLNMTVLADHVSGGHFRNDANGQIPAAMKQAIEAFFAQYGRYIQFYELGNEPCMFGGGYAEYLAAAKYLSSSMPDHIKLVATGWAYGGGKGTPVNWDSEAGLRAKIESFCRATNGHSYGYSYADNKGGSFVETLNTYQGVDDGWPKEFINSETGTNNWHSEKNGPRFASSQPQAQAFDRILRAHVAVADRTMQHAAVFDDFGLFKPQTTWNDTAWAYPGVEGQDTRLKTFRRLALAYATHGAPLPYVITNLSEISGQKLYFRAVDTAAIPGQAGSNATANKILLNFVNFDLAPRTLKVRITLPMAGNYTADRFGAEDSYAAAHSTMTLRATPTLDLNEQLGAGEAVQYILTSPGAIVPYSPSAPTIRPGDGEAHLVWQASARASGYEIRRSTRGGPLVSVASNITATHYTDTGLANGDTYLYAIRAGNGAGSSQDSACASVVAGAPLPPENLTAQSGDSSVALAWTASARTRSYRILRASGRNGSYQDIGTTEALNYLDSNLTNDAAYRYTVTAINDSGESERSMPVAGTPQVSPPAPTELIALAGDRRVVVRWKAVPGATTYSVKRSATAGGPYQIVAGEVAGTMYTDDAVSGGSYYYVVSAFKSGPEGIPSAEVAATVQTEQIPLPWKHQDIGPVRLAGSASYTPAGEIFTVQASGDDVWGKADGIHFLYQPLSGDGSLVAHVVSFDNTHSAARAGLAIREGLEPGAAMATAALSPGSASLTTRSIAGGDCSHHGGPFKPWIKISRTGDTISSFLSDDGQTWKPLASSKLAIGKDALIGLIVCSHQNGMLNKAMFDHVSLLREP